jgi:hypothetical protein
LLRSGLSEKLQLADVSGRKVLICVDENLPETSRGRFSLRPDQASFTLTRTELEAWLHFVLMAYRDGEAQASHFDLDLDSDRSDTKQAVMITFTFERAKPPIEREELLRKLGLIEE